MRLNYLANSSELCSLKKKKNAVEGDGSLTIFDSWNVLKL